MLHHALLGRAIPEDGLHLDAVVHVHHAAGLGHRRLAGVEFNLHILHLLTEDLEIDLMGQGMLVKGGLGQSRALGVIEVLR